MINKLTLQSIINKYYLGENESVKWDIEDKVLTVKFMSANKEVIGELTHTNFDLEDSELAIFDTKKLINLLNITTGDVLVELEKTHKVFTKLLISDQDFNLSYALADLLLISKVGTVSEPSWDVVINLEKEQVSNLVKAKSALAEVDNMVITTELDMNKDLMCKFTFGDEHGHNNKITYQLYGEINDPNIKLPFNSNIFKTILNVNKDLDSGTLKISSKGLMKLEFTSNDTECKYYLIRKESTNF
jgi:hypothetical protein|tara:strand:- start:341 stop:1075 length:735 start_codon:yes stop_codon:yes gene_type:complete